jgi:hypothetical protein
MNYTDDLVRSELDDARHEVIVTHAKLDLLRLKPASCPPYMPSFKTDCAVRWKTLLYRPFGRVKFRRYGAARTMSWWVVSWKADGKKEQPTCHEMCERKTRRDHDQTR